MAGPNLTTASFMMLGGNLIYSVGAFVADWTETHVLNPNWPPHAKFHNGQTMSLGILLTIASTYFAFKPSSSVAERRHDAFSAAFIGSCYCAAGLSAILYPGTDWEDPDYKHSGGGQFYLFGGQVALMWVAYAVELRRLGKGKTA